MKKILISTTALVAAGLLAAPASAADPIKLTVGGYMEQYVGIADQDSVSGTRDIALIDQQADNEVYFRGSTKLDNGITIAVQMDLEADHAAGGAANNWDDVFLRILSPTLGDLRLGSTPSALPTMAIHAPEAGIGLSDWDDWIMGPTTGLTNSSDDDLDVDDSDNNKIVYFSPVFAGFRLGASYTPDQTNDADTPVNRANDGADRQYSLAAAWDGKLGGAEVGVAGGYQKNRGQLTTATGTNSRNSEWAIGAKVAFAGLTIGAEHQRGTDKMAGSATEGIRGWGVGAMYKTGPYAVSANYRVVRNKVVATGKNDESTLVMISGSYTLGPGIVWQNSAFHADVKDDANVKANENQGYAYVTGLRVDF